MPVKRIVGATRTALPAVLALACASSPEPRLGPALAHCERDLPSAQRETIRPRRFGDHDRDDDGILDQVDRCPKLPEDHDGFEDHDGCPDCDDDQDGIPDAEWLRRSNATYRRRKAWTSAEGWFGRHSCRDIAETINGVQDEDGCPEVDEIVLDPTTCAEAMEQVLRDRGYHSGSLPSSLGLFATFAAYPADSDGDGYDDVADACPYLAEDFDAFEDEDGCPDCDNDQDGIPDADVWVATPEYDGWANRDQANGVDCRNEPEDIDGDRDEDGCPDLD